MATTSSTTVNYCLAFKSILKQLAASSPQGQWLIVNYDDDSDRNMLAHYLHICYSELEAFLQNISIYYFVGSNIKVNCPLMSEFAELIKNVEYTPVQSYHVMVAIDPSTTLFELEHIEAILGHLPSLSNSTWLIKG